MNLLSHIAYVSRKQRYWGLFLTLCNEMRLDRDLIRRCLDPRVEGPICSRRRHKTVGGDATCERTRAWSHRISGVVVSGAPREQQK